MTAGFKKKNALEKIWLKVTDNYSYKKYKQQLKSNQHQQALANFFTSNRVLDLEKVSSDTSKSEFISVVHSGNAGDIIYALPTLKKIVEVVQKPVKFYFKLNQPLKIPTYYTHPLGDVMLNEKMAEMLTPLLVSQDYIMGCDIYDGHHIDINLDDFRHSGILTDRGDIARWCSYLTGANPQLHRPWLHLQPDISFSDAIVIGRSERYRNSLIDYSFLQSYKNLVFVGVESEYNDIKQIIPDIKWTEVNNFKRLAEIISGCKLFIGNQSFPFSIAEGLKVPRILEVFISAPNVIPAGENGYDFLFQSHFEYLVKYFVYENQRLCEFNK